ncbi:major capsid protein [uncultured Caudovirales phage]|uniref:Major capsid protein n=1 Tax=uncultured Caudovirales phage TaxID=2100421 RepID=A0A6J5MS65_9CAUD|nr:major capsid protein [uncultured Caudovirales phage]
MSVLSSIHPTLLDVTKRLDPNGKIDTIAEILNETNPILEDMVWIEGNLPTGHRTTVRTGLPTPTWRKLYGGVQPTKSTTIQITDSTGMLEAYAEVDKALADLNGNTAAFRLSEDRAHIEGMNQEVAQTIFYGNEGSEPEAFTGLAPRFNSLSAQNGQNIIQNPGIDGSDNASIWLVVWGANTAHGIYPKGSKAGLSMDDKGQVTLENVDGNGGRMEAYRTHYRWDAGLTVRDWRYIVRIQYDQENLTKDAATGPDLVDLMTDAIERVPSLNMGRPVFYANRRALSFLRRQIKSAVTASTLTMEDVAGKKVSHFDGIPVRRVDVLNNNEAAVV